MKVENSEGRGRGREEWGIFLHSVIGSSCCEEKGEEETKGSGVVRTRAVCNENGSHFLYLYSINLFACRPLLINYVCFNWYTSVKKILKSTTFQFCP